MPPFFGTKRLQIGTVLFIYEFLQVYKLDKKYEPDGDNSYLKLAHLKIGQTLKQSSKQNGGTTGGLTLLPRDVFTVQTTLASTKLTQNEG